MALIATHDDRALAEHQIQVLPRSSLVPGTRLFAAVSSARRAIKGFRPDVVHAHFINEAGWIAAAVRSRPFVITAWGSDIYRAPNESRLARRLNPWAVKRADYVTCDSEDQARVLRSWGVDADRVAVVGWGVARDKFHPGLDGSTVRSRLGIPTGASVVLSPRQWLPNSNIDTVVAAHELLGEDVYLVLKRQARFERVSIDAIDKAIAESRARERIRVVDEMPTDDLPQLYAAADCVVSLCTTDGTPVSLLEAMAVGRPVVALQNPSVMEWVSEPGGRVVPRLVTRDIADSIESVLSPRARTEAAKHNVELVARRADRAAEMVRMADLYAALLSLVPRRRRFDG